MNHYCPPDCGRAMRLYPKENRWLSQHIEKEKGVRMTQVVSARARPAAVVHRPTNSNRKVTWSFVYHALGLDDGLSDFMSLTPWVEADEMNCRICAPVIQGLDLGMLIEGFKKLGIEVRFLVPVELPEFPANARTPDKGSYWVAIHNNDAADPDRASQSVKSLDERGVRGCTLIEYLLFSYASCFFSGLPLDGAGGTATLCSGSRRGESVPVVEYCPKNKTLYIGHFSVSSSGKAFRVREVFTQM